MSTSPPEFSRPIVVSGLAGGGVLRMELSARTNERDALARRFGLLGLDRFEARVSLSREDAAGGGWLLHVEGELEAAVTQTCVATLEAVANDVHDSFAVVYAVGARQTGTAETVVDPDGADPPEPLEGDSLDLGELVAQHLALALDPYPRAPGAPPPDEPLRPDGKRATTGPAAEASPFSVLRGWRDSAGRGRP